MSISIWLKDFQSFDTAGAGLDRMGRINVIVGPNNAGKSKLLRAVDRTVRQPSEGALIGEAGQPYTIDVRRVLTESELKSVFNPGAYGGTIPGRNHWEEFGKFAIGTQATIRYDTSNDTRVVQVYPTYNNGPSYGGEENCLKIVTTTVSSLRPGWSPLLSLPVYYMSAERDVVPETQGLRDAVQPDGSGVTSLIQQALLDSTKSAEPVEHWLLADLNRIMAPDHHFTRILTRFRSSNQWEIFLEEEGKGLVPLSQCGSGLKTVLHLLAYTNLSAHRRGEKISAGTFLLEELENCLHPHVQRNLFAYLDDVLVLPARAFLTTHSSVCLDYFQGHDDAILTHVYQENRKTRSRVVEAFQDRCGALDRMGSRASDALQCNSVIWVEGPSDRILLKKWFDLCDADVREGAHFAIMLYGGDLLAHLTMGSEEEEIAEYIRLLRINRNSAIIIDSDKTHQAAPLRETKKRVKEEAERERRFVWITKGKEIENYVAPGFFARTIEDAPVIGQYEPPWPKIGGTRATGSSRAFHTKVEFAEFVAQKATTADFQFDWKDRTDELIAFIRKANGI